MRPPGAFPHDFHSAQSLTPDILQKGLEHDFHSAQSLTPDILQKGLELPEGKQPCQRRTEKANSTGHQLNHQTTVLPLAE